MDHKLCHIWQTRLRQGRGGGGEGEGEGEEGGERIDFRPKLILWMKVDSWPMKTDSLRHMRSLIFIYRKVSTLKGPNLVKIELKLAKLCLFLTEAIRRWIFGIICGLNWRVAFHFCYRNKIFSVGNRDLFFLIGGSDGFSFHHVISITSMLIFTKYTIHGLHAPIPPYLILSTSVISTL